MSTEAETSTSSWARFAHDADIGVVGVGPTTSEAFRQAALALTAVISDPIALAGAPGAAAASQEQQTRSGSAGVLTVIHITQSVMVNGKPLPAGMYELRPTNERPTPLPGQSPDAERWVEFVANGSVVAREIAEVLRDDDLPAEGASSVPTREGTRVELLKGGEFLRISVKRGTERYLVYLPVAP